MSIDAKIQATKIEVTHQGVWDITKDVKIDCYVTKDKRRLMSLRGTARVMNIKGGGSGGLLRNLKAKYLTPYLSDHLKMWITRASRGGFSKIKAVHGPSFIPFEGTLFVDVCRAYVDADNAGVLNEQQMSTANRLLGIMTAFAKVGIVSIIDETTGYQEDRNITELQKLFNLYVSERHSPWAKRFPNDFYQEIHRLKRWVYDPQQGSKMPQVIGTYTNDLIYSYLPDGVLEILKEKTPKSKAGNNLVRLHQSLTPEQGIQHLVSHMNTVMALMKISNTWEEFLYVFDVNFNNTAQQRFTFTY